MSERIRTEGLLPVLLTALGLVVAALVPVPASADCDSGATFTRITTTGRFWPSVPWTIPWARPWPRP
jgi:hypothetical protein